MCWWQREKWAHQSIHILYTYSTVSVTTVFPASSETIENVLSDRKNLCVCVCVIRLWVCSVESTSGLGHVNKPQAAESVLRKAQRDIKDRGKAWRRGRKEGRKDRKEGSIIILPAQVNRNTKDNIASPRTSFNCSVYIKLEESYTVIYSYISLYNSKIIYTNNSYIL